MTHPHLHPPPYRFLYVESVIRGANEMKLELILWPTIYDTACLQILNLHSCWSLAVLLLSIQVHNGHYSVRQALRNYCTFINFSWHPFPTLAIEVGGMPCWPKLS